MKERITLMSAIADNGIVGAKNKLPWMGKVPRDLPHFAEQTKMGKTNALVMGRLTFESFGAVPLKGRMNIVASKTWEPGLHKNGIMVFSEIGDAVDYAVSNFEETFLIGGTAIWAYGLEVANRAIITRIHQDFEGDTYFPVKEFEQKFSLVYQQKWIEKDEGKISSTLQVWT